MRRESIHVRDAADIRRASRRLFARRRPPRITVDTDRFPLLFAQRAQDRLAHLVDDCNCLFGEVLAGAALMVGLAAVWVYSLGWLDVGKVLIAALGLLCIGKAIEAAWTRLRMLSVVLGLRRRLDLSRDLPATRPARESWHVATNPVQRESPVDVAQNMPVARPPKRRVRRPKVVLGTAADINRLRLRVVAGLRLPRLEVRIAGLPEPDAQRAQHRYARIAEGASFMLGGVLATLTLLGGIANAVMQETPDADPIADPELWVTRLGWHNVQSILLATLFAGALGWAIEQAVIRVRLMRVLGGLRRNLNAVAPS